MIGVIMRIFSFTLVSWLGPDSPFLFVWVFNTIDVHSAFLVCLTQKGPSLYHIEFILDSCWDYWNFESHWLHLI